jgi:integral membrane sensor domain MASE1
VDLVAGRCDRNDHRRAAGPELVPCATTTAWLPQKKWEAACFGLLLALTVYAISADRASHFAPFSLTFVSLPFILWAGFRFGQREVASAIAVVCAVAVWYTLERRELFRVRAAQ